MITHHRKHFFYLKKKINSSSFYGKGRENVFNKKIKKKKPSLKLNGMNDSLVIYVRNDTFDSINNEFRV